MLAITVCRANWKIGNGYARRRAIEKVERMKLELSESQSRCRNAIEPPQRHELTSYQWDLVQNHLP